MDDSMTGTAIVRRRIGGTPRVSSMKSAVAAPLGGLFRASSQDDADATIAAALSAGITHIDVAPQYGRGLAEQRVGRALTSQRRDEFVLSTKVGRLLIPTDTPEPMRNFPEALGVRMTYDTSADGIRRSLDDSIERMGELAPDILLLHDPDRYAEGDALRRLIESAHTALVDLKRQGRIGAIGIGVNAPEPCRIALDVGAWDCFLLAGRYSVLRQDDDGILDACRAHGTSVFVGAPFMSGALAGGSTWRYGPIPDDVAYDLGRLRATCARFAVPVEAVALQYPLRHPAVASVVVGMRSPDEVSRNVSALLSAVPEALWTELHELGFIDRSPESDGRS